MIGASFFSFSSHLAAATCDIGTAPQPEIAGRNLLMEMPKGRALLLIGTPEISNEERLKFSEMYWLREPEGENIPQKLSEILTKNAAVLEANERNLALLRELLSQKKLEFVAIEANQANLRQWNKAASDLYVHEFVQSLRRPAPQENAWRQLLLITIGAPLYIKQSQPEIFQDVRFEGVDVNASTTRSVNVEAPASDDVLRKRAAEKTASVMRSLEDNPRSRRAFQNAVALVRPGSPFVRGKSNAEIKNYVLARTWRPIREKSVSGWTYSLPQFIRNQKLQHQRPRGILSLNRSAIST